MVYTNKDGYGIKRKGFLRWTIDKPKTVKPEIVGEEMIGEVLHYVDKEGRKFRADSFMRIWGKVK